VRWILAIILANAINNFALDSLVIEFEEEKSGYRIYCRIETFLPVDSAFSLLYRFEHYKNYAKGFDKIDLLDSQNNEYTTRLKKSLGFFKLEMIYRRVKIPDQWGFNYELVSFSQSPSFIPPISDSRGIYQVSVISKKTVIEVRQTTLMEDEMNWFQRRMAKKQTNKFFNNLYEYVKSFEK
jgi:hypothetical protein